MPPFQAAGGRRTSCPWGVMRKELKILMYVCLEMQSLGSTGFPDFKLRTNSEWQGNICVGRGLWGIDLSNYRRSCVWAPRPLHIRSCWCKCSTRAPWFLARSTRHPTGEPWVCSEPQPTRPGTLEGTWEDGPLAGGCVLKDLCDCHQAQRRGKGKQNR